MLCREALWKSTLLGCHCNQILQWNFESSRLQQLQSSLWPGGFRACGTRLEPGCAAPVWSSACSQSSCSMWCNPHSAKSLEVVIDCVGGAVSFMSKCTVYVGKVSHMVCPPSSVVCWSGRMHWMFSAELWWKYEKYKTFTVVSASLMHFPLSLNIMDRKIIYFSSEILYVILCTFWLFQSGLFLREFPRKFIPTSAFSHLHFCSLFHVARTYWQVFLAEV